MRLALAALVLGCSSDVRSQPDARPDTLSSEAPASRAPATAPAGNPSMEDGFAKATEAFTAAAAAHFAIGADQVTTVPRAEVLAGMWKVASGADQINPMVGKAFAFEAAQTGVVGRTFRGWALPDGTVITQKQNLGALLKAAEAGGVSVDDVVRRLIWSFGPPHVPSDAPAAVEGDTVRFETRLVIPGGPQQSARFVITRAADGSAQLSVSK